MNLMKGDSLLSNISNVSVMIKPGEDSMFNMSILNNSQIADQSEKLCEVKLDDIFPPSHHIRDSTSMFDGLIRKVDKDSSIIQSYYTPILPQVTYNHFNQKSWMITHQKGVSEDENSDEQKKEIEDQQYQQSEKKGKNQTKNIPKNYGKAIISFIQKYHSLVAEICQHTGVPFDRFLQQLIEFKKKINSIADLRRLWSDYRYARCMRIISNLFLRKYSLNYIFNSRVCNFKSHIKYRHRMCEAVRNPKSFRHIKDY